MASLLKLGWWVYNINITHFRGEAGLELNIDFSLVRSQKLLLIPQLKQALEILSMNSQELSHYVEEQLEINPFMECITMECITEEKTFYLGDAEDTDETTASDMTSTITLKEHLLLQLNSLNLEKTQESIGEYLIDNTDENGYLKTDIFEVSAFFNTSAAKVVRILKILQGFDPPGICARNLKECLLIQLAQMENTNREAALIVRHYIDRLAENDMDAVAAETGLEEKQVEEAFRLIRTLEPRPGREFFRDEDNRPAVADIIVRELNGSYIAILNEEAFPEVNIVEHYGPEDMIKADEETDDFIREGVSSAVWLIKCMEQRENIILQIAQNIVRGQHEFFEKGAEYLKSVSSKQLGEDMNMHESVLSQALKEKYLQCRWGLFEFNYFFEIY
ncbi:MAG: RNA polymerase factor sigma-54 [Ruminiclostridium sp.]|nr:RNA polymerase factor sigma-54 [Ruminiclostridium sp.]